MSGKNVHIWCLPPNILYVKVSSGLYLFQVKQKKNNPTFQNPEVYFRKWTWLIESQSILDWKGHMRVIKSKYWLQTGQPKC